MRRFHFLHYAFLIVYWSVAYLNFLYILSPSCLQYVSIKIFDIFISILICLRSGGWFFHSFSPLTHISSTCTLDLRKMTRMPPLLGVIRPRLSSCAESSEPCLTWNKMCQVCQREKYCQVQVLIPRSKLKPKFKLNKIKMIKRISRFDTSKSKIYISNLYLMLEIWIYISKLNFKSTFQTTFKPTLQLSIMSSD